GHQRRGREARQLGVHEARPAADRPAAPPRARRPHLPGRLMSTATTATQPLPARIRRTPGPIRVLLIVVVIGYAIFAIGSGVITLPHAGARPTLTRRAHTRRRQHV